MNPAALKANAKWAKPTASIILDSDTFDAYSIKGLVLRADDPITELKK